MVLSFILTAVLAHPTQHGLQNTIKVNNPYSTPTSLQQLLCKHTGYVHLSPVTLLVVSIHEAAP